MQGAPTQARAFVQGLRAFYSVAAFVLFATALGFGALARDAGFSVCHVAFLSLTMFALPTRWSSSTSWRGAPPLPVRPWP